MSVTPIKPGIDFSADAPGAQPSASAADQLTRVGQMADTLTNAQIALADAEAALEVREDALRKITREEFPELLREVGLSKIELSDKRVIVLSDEIDCGISEENRPAAHAWLRKGGFGGLIKTSVIVDFDRGEEAEMRQLLEVIAAHFRAKEQERVAEVKEGVHWSTLKSFVKEQRAKGAPPPDDLFGVFPYSKVDVKSPKGSGGFQLKRRYKKS